MSLFEPDLYYRSIADVDPADLLGRGVRNVLLDLDNTLVRRNTLEASDAVRAWLAEASETGLNLVVVSNNWHDRVRSASGVLGIPVVGKATKPLPGGFRRALRQTRASGPSAVIGDQIFTDVLGGKLLGATTVLVAPLAGGSDLPHTRVLRALERRILRGRVPEMRASEEARG
jgi:HAD superfamily phosphatase (TIGR01668 family)